MTLGTNDRPLRVAIVGAGPTGFFAAAALFKKEDVAVSVDLFDKLPAPFGLVRNGVAPDHQEIKRVTKAYEKTAADPRFRFFGNVKFGRDLDHADLRAHYDHVIYAVGAQSDRAMGIPGEDLPGSFSATEFVAWYNGHPEFADLQFDLSHPTAVVVGIGNVAMDAARILAKSHDELAKTDLADHALEALRESKVKEVYVLGRRGPVQAKFTTPEIKEFGELEVAQTIIRADELELEEISEAALAGNKVATRNMDVMREYADAEASEKPRRVHFRFKVSPVEIFGDDRVTGVKIVRNELRQDETGYISCHAVDAFENLDCGLILRSVGYLGVPLPGVPHLERKGTIPHERGRVRTAEGEVVAGEYVAGWAKRGPSGVIGTNKACAVETVTSMLEDLPKTTPVDADKADLAAMPALLESRGVRYMTFDQWKQVDAVELAAGATSGRPRVKLITADQMFDSIQS